MVLAGTIPNYRYGHLTPPEDAFKYNLHKKIFVVADGITRDPLEIDNFGNTLHYEEVLATYPNPSGARLAADVFL